MDFFIPLMIICSALLFFGSSILFADKEIEPELSE